MAITNDDGLHARSDLETEMLTSAIWQLASLDDRRAVKGHSATCRRSRRVANIEKGLAGCFPSVGVVRPKVLRRGDSASKDGMVTRHLCDNLMPKLRFAASLK